MSDYFSYGDLPFKDRRRSDFAGFAMALVQLLASDKFVCPGGHGDGPRTGFDRFYEEMLENAEAEAGYYDVMELHCVTCHHRVGMDSSYDLQSSVERAAWYESTVLARVYGPKSPEVPKPDGWRDEHACQDMITVGEDGDYSEYDGRSYSWPVAEGPCAEALGLDEDEEYRHALWDRHRERDWLFNHAKKLAQQFGVQDAFEEAEYQGKPLWYRGS